MCGNAARSRQPRGQDVTLDAKKADLCDLAAEGVGPAVAGSEVLEVNRGRGLADGRME